MSSYEDYTKKSRNYDKTRQVVGAEIIIGCFATGNVPLGVMKVLDAGCGTGSYSDAVLEHVGRIEAVDVNEGMIEVAARKLSEAGSNGRISFHQSRIDELPFDDASFDGIMVNQVLHHLPDDAPEGFPAHRDVFREFARVLKPGGVLTVNTSSLEQLTNGYWYYALIPDAAKTIRRRFAPLEELTAMLRENGFSYRGRFTPTDAVIQGPSYFDPRGPLSKEWRDGDSAWALVPEDELERALSLVRQLDESGALESFVAEHDARRPDVGQISLLSASRD